ncbi:MAG: DUF1499 domain-containing protein [Cohaesibacteraceae bacterium]|nr:DUF1499 domain-containing protein [Cohaesibacteraceae bacterium]
MTGQYVRGHSKSARWSQRFGRIAVLVLIIALVGRRFDYLTVPEFFAVYALGCLVALCALTLAFWAIGSLWVSGHEGWSKMIWGGIYSSVVLLMPAIGLVAYFYYPVLNDVSTDHRNPPVFQQAHSLVRDGASTLDTQSGSVYAAQLKAFPDLVPRYLSFSPDEIYPIVHKLVTDYGWKVLSTDVPRSPEDPGHLELLAETLILRLPDVVIIRLEPDGENGTRMDARSASLYGKLDLGANARRLRTLFHDLVEPIRRARVRKLNTPEPENIPVL